VADDPNEVRAQEKLAPILSELIEERLDPAIAEQLTERDTEAIFVALAKAFIHGAHLVSTNVAATLIERGMTGIEVAPLPDLAGADTWAQKYGNPEA
jgi:hypothetical protein